MHMFGEILGSEMEFDNSHDKYAMAVKNQDGNLVEYHGTKGIIEALS